MRQELSSPSFLRILTFSLRDAVARTFSHLRSVRTRLMARWELTVILLASSELRRRHSRSTTSASSGVRAIGQTCSLPATGERWPFVTRLMLLLLRAIILRRAVSPEMVDVLKTLTVALIVFFFSIFVCGWKFDF